MTPSGLPPRRRNEHLPPPSSRSWGSDRHCCASTTLPPDKFTSLLHKLNSFSTRQKCTKRALLSLIGKLSFAAKVIQDIYQCPCPVPPPSHALRKNSKSFFLDHNRTPSPAFQLFTDVSDLGYGAYWAGSAVLGHHNRDREICSGVRPGRSNSVGGSLGTEMTPYPL